MVFSVLWLFDELLGMMSCLHWCGMLFLLCGVVWCCVGFCCVVLCGVVWCCVASLVWCGVVWFIVLCCVVVLWFDELPGMMSCLPWCGMLFLYCIVLHCIVLCDVMWCGVVWCGSLCCGCFTYCFSMMSCLPWCIMFFCYGAAAAAVFL